MASEIFDFLKRNPVSIWNWIQKYKSQKVSIKRKEISKYVVDKTQLKVGSDYIWLWVAIDTKNKRILALSISKRNMFVSERFMSNLVDNYGFYPVSIDGILSNINSLIRFP